MSTGTRQSRADAIQSAERLRDLFDGCYERWEIAGSVRRGKAEVGDVEHVIIPKIGEYTMPGEMFTTTGNLLWSRADRLVGGVVTKAVYPNGTHRWGERYRGVEFQGIKHELFTATETNFGSVLTIRTGPWEFSQRMVTHLHKYGLRHDKGYVLDGEGNVVPTPDEETFFGLCGVPYKEPEDRA